MLRSTTLLAIALCIAGCAAPLSQNTSGNAEMFPPTPEVERLQLPFDAYSFSLADLYTISNAQDLLIKECMQARGHDWEIVTRPTEVKDLRNRRRYGVLEIRIAQQFGYHAPPGLLTPLDVEQQYDKRESGLSESQKEIAFGTDGCGYEATTRLQPAASPDPSLLDQLSRESLEESQAEPTVAAAIVSWRECVRRMGFDYQNPFAAISDPQWWTDDSVGPSPQETAVAVADVSCKQQTGLIDLWHAAEVRIQERLIAQYPDYFHQLSVAMKEELAATQALQRK